MMQNSHKYINRISHGLWLDMTFIQWFVCIYVGSPKVCGWIWFLSNDLCVFYPRALTHNKLDKNHIQLQTMGDSFCHMLQHHFLSLHKFYVAFYMQKFLASFKEYYVIIHCDVIAVVYEKFIKWVISTGYEGKHVLKQNILYCLWNVLTKCERKKTCIDIPHLHLLKYPFQWRPKWSTCSSTGPSQHTSCEL